MKKLAILLVFTALAARAFGFGFGDVAFVRNIPTADARAWNTAVIANSSTASALTRYAVNDFVVGTYAASAKVANLRVNLFAGAGLNAALVPLWVGAGSSTDTNNNFVSGDYVESTGLTGDGSTKYLDSGVPLNTYSASDIHLSIYNKTAYASFPAAFSDLMGVYTVATTGTQMLRPRGSDTYLSYTFGSSANKGYGFATNTSHDMLGWIIGSATTINPVFYVAGATFGSAGGGAADAISVTSHIYVFAIFYSGTGGALQQSPGTACGYSLGAGYTSTTVSAMNTVWTQFNTVLGRQ